MRQKKPLRRQQYSQRDTTAKTKKIEQAFRLPFRVGAGHTRKADLSGATTEAH